MPIRTSTLVLACLAVVLLACAPLGTFESYLDQATPTATDTPAVFIAHWVATPTVTKPTFTPTSKPSPRARANPRATAVVPPQSHATIAASSLPAPSVSTAHENLYFAPGVPADFQKAVIGDAAVAAQNLMQDMGWSGSPRVSIFVYPSRSAWLNGIDQTGELPATQVAFQQQLQGDTWLTISGTAHPGLYIYPIQQTAFEMLHMLAHEYTHGVQRQILPDSAVAPDWFLEGMAEAEGWHIAGTTDANQYALYHGQVQRMVHEAADRSQLFSLTSLSIQENWQARLEMPRAGTLEYAESDMSVEYLEQIQGSGAPTRLLKGIAAGASFDAAFRQVSGMPVSQFQVQFESAMR